MMAYVQIPNFGRFPMYVGKEYLRGFVDGCSDTISYEMYCEAKKVFSEFWDILDTVYEIPMFWNFRRSFFVKHDFTINKRRNRFSFFDCENRRCCAVCPE